MYPHICYGAQDTIYASVLNGLRLDLILGDMETEPSTRAHFLYIEKTK